MERPEPTSTDLIADIENGMRALLGRLIRPARRFRTATYPGAARRDDGWDEWRLARAADKRTRRAHRNLHNARKAGGATEVDR